MLKGWIAPEFYGLQIASQGSPPRPAGPEAGTKNYVAGTGTAPPHIAEQNQQRLFWNTAICRTSFVVVHTALFLIRPNSESP